MSGIEFLVGRAVVAVKDGRIVFALGEDGEPALYADVGDCSYTDKDGTGWPESAMVGNVVADTSTEGGTLVLSFADERMLRCEPQPDVEAWQVVGGAPQYLVVCMPGGGEPAVWDSSHIPGAGDKEKAIDQLTRLFGMPPPGSVKREDA